MWKRSWKGPAEIWVVRKSILDQKRAWGSESLWKSHLPVITIIGAINDCYIAFSSLPWLQNGFYWQLR